MYEIISKIIKNRNNLHSLPQEDMTNFVNESFKLFRNKYPTPEELDKIIKGFNHGIFDIQSTINNILNNLNKLNLNSTILYDKSGNILDIYFK